MMIAADSIPDVMHLSLKGKRAVYKSEMMMYEMLAQCNWERPLYVAITVGKDNYGNLGDYFVREGLADRITPFNTKKSGRTVDTEKMYDNLMNRFRYGGLDNPDFYIDETISRMSYTHRRIFSQLATQLLREGKKEKAQNLLKRAEEVLPPTTLPHTFAGGSLDLARAWIQLDNKKQAEAIALPVAKNACEYIDWYLSLSDSKLEREEQECMYYLYQLHRASEVLREATSSQAAGMVQKLDFYNKVLQGRLYGTQNIYQQMGTDVSNMMVANPEASEEEGE